MLNRFHKFQCCKEARWTGVHPITFLPLPWDFGPFTEPFNGTTALAIMHFILSWLINMWACTVEAGIHYTDMALKMWKRKSFGNIRAIIFTISKPIQTELKKQRAIQSHFTLHFPSQWHECTHCHVNVPSLSFSPLFLYSYTLFLKHWKVQLPSTSRDGACNEHEWVCHPQINHWS